jgi:hypothetical protein
MAKVKKSVKKAQLGDILKTISPLGGAVAGLFGKKKQAPVQPPAAGMMKKGGKMKKAQAGTSAPKKKAVDSVRSEMFPGKMIPKSKSNFENRNFDKTANALKPAAKKAKSGGSFPDLNKDGKITQKDILIGKGVLPKTAKKGMKLKKQAAIAISMKKAGIAPKKKMQYGGAAASMVPKGAKKANYGTSMMKMGGTTKKCMYGCK